MTNSADPDQLEKPTDLDLHCLLNQGMLCLAREGLTCKAPNKTCSNHDILSLKKKKK